jgi:BCD family chlorophyll transporter-like MFS transporter
MALLAASGIAVAMTLPVMETSPALGIGLAALAFVALGAGVSAAGTPLLALISLHARPSQRAGAAAMTWILMIVGFIVTTATVGSLLDPFSFARLLTITAGVCAGALVLTMLTLWGLERRLGAAQAAPAIPAEERGTAFRAALRSVWDEPHSRLFAIFVFVAMLAYSTQDLILEPFCGIAFGMTPGETTKVSGMQQGGVLIGMILTAVLGARHGALRTWAAWGCVGSAVACGAIAASPAFASEAMFRGLVAFLGFANGVFAIGAIGSMMALTGDAGDGRAGLRLGVYGAAQAVAYGIGGFVGAAGADVGRLVSGAPVMGYATVFSIEAAGFVVAAVLALRSASRERAGDVMRDRGEMLAAVVN